MKIIWSPLALDRIAEISQYISKDSPAAARKWIDTVFNKVETLTNFPEMGRMVPEANRKEIRELLIKNYRVIYRIKDEQISILTVRHGKQLLPKEDLK